MKPVIRWLLVPAASIGGFVTALALAFPVYYLLHALILGTGHHLPGKLFFLLQLPFDGAIAAFLAVTLGAWMAPHHRLNTSLVIFFCGAILAWLLVGDFGHPYRPVRVWSPIIGTYLGGLFGVLVISIRERRKLRRPSQLSSSNPDLKADDRKGIFRP
jgi:hypothetical protein